MKPHVMRFETVAVHAGGEPDPATGAVAPPLHLSTTFVHGPESAFLPEPGSLPAARASLQTVSRRAWRASPSCSSASRMTTPSTIAGSCR